MVIFEKKKKGMKMLVLLIVYVIMVIVLLFQVKVVRETMNRALDMWKEVSDFSENIPAPLKSACASNGKVPFV